MLSHLMSGWKGLYVAKNNQPGKKLEDMACKMGTLFQVQDFSLVSSTLPPEAISVGAVYCLKGI